jgi:hypothetical protein
MRTKQTTYSLSLTNSSNLLYYVRLIGHRLDRAPQLMRLRRAVLQIPRKSSVPPGLLLYKSHPLLTSSKSTLLQVLIPLHFNSPRINTYKKPGRGSHPRAPKFCNSLLPSPRPSLLATRHSPLATVPVTPFTATLTDLSQLTENPVTLNPVSANVDVASSISPLFATLTKNTRGGGTLSIASLLFAAELPSSQLSTGNLLLLPSHPHPGATYA